MGNIVDDRLVDACDLMCPMQVVAGSKAMRRLAPGE